MHSLVHAVSVVIVVLIGLGLPRISGYPTPTIDNPCQFNPTAVIELPPIRDLLISANTQANAAAASCQAFMNKIKNDRLLTDQEYLDFSGPIYPLPGLPSRIEAVNFTQANMGILLKQLYNATSIHIMYQTMALEEQLAFDSSRYSDEIQSILHEQRSLLCKTDMLLRAVKVTMTQFVNSSVVPGMIKNFTDDKRRYKRDLAMTAQSKSMAQSQALIFVKFNEAM